MNPKSIEIKQIFDYLFDKRFRGSITIHLDGNGGYVPEFDLKVKGSEVNKILTDKKEVKNGLRKTESFH